jgi:hypothetical protein
MKDIDFEEFFNQVWIKDSILEKEYRLMKRERNLGTCSWDYWFKYINDLQIKLTFFVNQEVIIKKKNPILHDHTT